MVPYAIEWSWPETPLAIAITIAVAVVARWLLLRGIRRASRLAVERANARRQQQGSDSEALLAARHAARAATMGSLLRSVVNATIAVLAVLTVLAILNIPLTPLLASAGVGGVALGFGAQSLVKDYLSGIFMIVEDQYGVGDLVDLGDVTGTVEDVGLRVTRVRDGSGQVWYVRNGEIVRVGNQSQGWSTAVVDIPVDTTENSTRVIEVLDAVVDAVHADPDWSSVLLETPKVVGVQSVEAGRMTIRVIAKTQPNQAAGVQRVILDRGLQALKDAGVKGPRVLPTPPTL
ncbi:mechanosensitive ion channel family protein [Micropruina sonneratiae]|uniref:mechanosensitive ion channel family protein n=1 Tax=Micropruina sonneratiae TaxID=2986940 RepID=UPI002226A4C0|nr:mechanosensitive ion channel family protein [Micropruina sp. KQZ13P-5]MCW3159248.1 mechanosensitive ion channel family protein [Micropruina sp. KQZ13P-5]